MSRPIIHCGSAQFTPSIRTDPIDRQRYSVYDPTSKKGSKHRPNLSVKLDITQQKTSSPEPKSTDAAVLKRRSTMNSRLAADGEEEQLRLALEASKHDAPEVAEGSVSRGTKRSREEDTE